ncbi:MAG: CDP-alcohol phosphatidyltransferase family protein [Clostridia bacterium]|nr:CDP-alcohol phosphatidyltransferase family protein [Clostridia bacterium]
MKNKPKLLGYYNYTVILTYIGMLIGFAGVFCVFEDRIFYAVLCLIAAGACDMFDGAIASTRERTEAEKCFGIQIDSLSDLICFGVLPAMIACGARGQALPILVIAALYVLCALIRLAYFNVDEQERQKNSSSSRELYLGMPVTVSALIVPLVFSVGSWFPAQRTVALAVALALSAILFLLPFPLKKPKLTGKIILVLCGFIELFLVVFIHVRLS